MVTAADTSSRAGAAIPVVDAPADAVASRIASPIPLKSDDAAAKASGVAIRKAVMRAPWLMTVFRANATRARTPPKTIHTFFATDNFPR